MAFRVKIDGIPMRVEGTVDAENIAIPVFNNSSRPAPSSVPIGYQIFNTDDGAPNFSTGTDWVDAMGDLT